MYCTIIYISTVVFTNYVEKEERFINLKVLMVIRKTKKIIDVVSKIISLNCDYNHIFFYFHPYNINMSNLNF